MKAALLQALCGCLRPRQSADGNNERQEYLFLGKKSATAIAAAGRHTPMVECIDPAAPIHQFFSLMLQGIADPVGLFSPVTGTLLAYNPAQEQLFIRTGHQAGNWSVHVLFAADGDALEEALAAVEQGSPWKGMRRVRDRNRLYCAQQRRCTRTHGELGSTCRTVLDPGKTALGENWPWYPYASHLDCYSGQV